MSDNQPTDVLLRHQDLSGRIFNNWEVLERAPNRNNDSGRFWLCRCICKRASLRILRTSVLIKGRPRSCGCVSSSKHGESSGGRRCGSKEYRVWVSIKDRCSNRNNELWYRYGGRGITMCSEWSQSFIEFLDGVGRAPTPQHSLDRIDNNKGYEPGNVRWATERQQSFNKTTTVLITYNGKTKNMREWSEETGLSYDQIKKRLRRGWTPEKIFTTPVRAFDRTQTITKAFLAGP